MKQVIDKIYDAIYDAYSTEKDPERQAMYDDTLTILANLEFLCPGLFS